MTTTFFLYSDKVNTEIYHIRFKVANDVLTRKISSLSNKYLHIKVYKAISYNFFWKEVIKYKKCVATCSVYLSDCYYILSL